MLPSILWALFFALTEISCYAKHNINSTKQLLPQLATPLRYMTRKAIARAPRDLNILEQSNVATFTSDTKVLTRENSTLLKSNETWTITSTASLKQRIELSTHALRSSMDNISSRSVSKVTKLSSQNHTETSQLASLKTSEYILSTEISNVNSKSASVLSSANKGSPHMETNQYKKSTLQVNILSGAIPRSVSLCVSRKIASTGTVASISTIFLAQSKAEQGFLASIVVSNVSTNDSNTAQPDSNWSLFSMAVDYSMGFYITAAFIGCIGNIYVLVDAFKALKRLHTNEIFLMQLCVVNIITLLSLTMMVIFMKIGFHFTCHVIFILTTGYQYINVYTLTVISLQQYNAIAFPFKPKLSLSKMVITTVLIFITSNLLSLPVMLEQSLLPRPCTSGPLNVSHRRLYYGSTTALQYVIPLTTIAIYYVKLAIFLKKSRLEIQQHSDGRQIESPRKKRDKRVVVVMVTMVISFAVCLLPQHVQFILIEFVFNKQVDNGMAVFSYFPILLKACIDPVIYGAMGRRLKSNCCGRRPTGQNSTHHTP